MHAFNFQMFLTWQRHRLSYLKFLTQPFKESEGFYVPLTDQVQLWDCNRRPGACFSKVPKLFGPFSGAAIPFIASQRGGCKPSNFAILLVVLTLKSCQKISFSKQADCSLKTGFSGPKRSWDFRETDPRPGLLEAWLVLTSVSYHRNVLVSIPLNQWLALTILRATGPRAINQRGKTGAKTSVPLSFTGKLPLLQRILA